MSTTLQAAPAVEAWLTAFSDLEADLSRHTPPALQRLRKAALGRFEQIGFPNSRNEDWKFTNLAPFLRTSFLPAPVEGEPFRLGGRPLPEGVQVIRLSEPLQHHPDLV